MTKNIFVCQSASDRVKDLSLSVWTSTANCRVSEGSAAETTQSDAVFNKLRAARSTARMNIEYPSNILNPDRRARPGCRMPVQARCAGRPCQMTHSHFPRIDLPAVRRARAPHGPVSAWLSITQKARAAPARRGGGRIGPRRQRDPPAAAARCMHGGRPAC